MRKTITLFISSLGGGGAERVCVTLARQFNKIGFTVNLIVLNLNNSVYHNILDKNINLISLNVNHARTSFIKLGSYLIKHKPQKILVFNHELAIVLVILRYLLFKNLIIIARNISTLSVKIKNESSVWHKYFKTILIRLFYKKVDNIIAQSEVMKTDLINYLNIPESKIEVIHNPSAFIDHKTIHQQAGHIEKKNEILFVGRIEKIKGLNYLFEAFSRIVKKKPHLKLRVVGEGSLMHDFKRYCSQQNINNKVIFSGFQTEIAKYYLQARVTVLTSIYEGFPNILVESLSLGTPVVAFDHISGPSEIIQEGVNGFLAKYLDINDLENTLLKALDFEWDIEQIQETAKKFDQQTITNKYLDILNN